MKNPDCQYLTFSGFPCIRPGKVGSPAGLRWCGIKHARGSKVTSSGMNSTCSCGSGRKHKRCCSALAADAAPQIQQAPTFKAGCHWRRWVIGLERDKARRVNILYIGPFYFAVRL